LSIKVLEDRMRLPCFASLLREGVVDFACVDTSNGLGTIQLLHSKRTIVSGSLTHPYVVIGNYLLDSLPIDIYRYAPIEPLPCTDGEGAAGGADAKSTQRSRRSVPSIPSHSQPLQRLCVALPRSAPITWKQWTEDATFEWSASTMVELVDSCTPRASLTEEKFAASDHHAAVLRAFASSEARARCKDGVHAPFIVPVGAVQLVRDIAMLRNSKSSCPHLCIFGDKTFGSKESSCIGFGSDLALGQGGVGGSSVNGGGGGGGGGGAPPIIVHHTSEGSTDDAGCVSVSVDLDLIAQLVELSVPRCSFCKRVYIADRINGSGGQFDVTMCSDTCHCGQETGARHGSSHESSGKGKGIGSADESHEQSPTDIEAVAEVAQASSEHWTASELLALLEISEFDAGMFSSICWPLSHKIRGTNVLETSRAQATVAVRARAKSVALQCLKNSCFELVAPAGSAQQAESAFKSALRTARFLYTIGLWNDAARVLRDCASATGRQEADHLRSKAEALGGSHGRVVSGNV
jgi:hypothetical protein